MHLIRSERRPARGPDVVEMADEPSAMGDECERSDCVVDVQHLHKAYGSTVAVDDVSFTVNKAEIFGVIGPNGAGKTTAVECLSGLRRPDTGSVRVFGLDPQRQRVALRQVVGVQLQEGSLPIRLKVSELVDLFASFYPHPANTDDLLELLGLTSKCRAYYGKLSGGQKQRVAIALALIGNPKVAILDELTTGLDPQARRDTWELIAGIRERGVTIVLVTHFMDEAERLCDRVMMVDRGQVVALDTPTAFAEHYGGGSHLSFRPTHPFNDALLITLPEVSGIEHVGDRVTVAGSGDLLGSVVHALESAGVEPVNAQLTTANLEDAFLRLTSRATVAPSEEASR